MNDKLALEVIEETMEAPQGVELPGAGARELRPAFEPAKEGEEPPKNIWIPNRRERRLMKKRGNKIEKAMSKFYQEAITDAKEYVNTSNYKNEIYKALYEKVKARNEEMEREIATNGTTVAEGN